MLIVYLQHGTLSDSIANYSGFCTTTVLEQGLVAGLIRQGSWGFQTNVR